ncbi:L-Aspartase-like protein [Pseudocohnilembus persalinus]|uniref:Histidine ammonia-lyase n=1 Tax=Pseudocohnilembus persalinus TaxID=266149 RepID=A0A0V0QHI2_PSEPJ|nr:L-Aspartase-like protein [Pseudocohnilembus persalinus]|eukprot:KRX01622.1 L-Aspartase-like protein [Pseudocohnilembus persalinus]
MQQQKSIIYLDKEPFTPELLKKLQEGNYAIDFTEETYNNIQKNREVFEEFTKKTDKHWSGVNSGLGFFSDVWVDNKDVEEMQYNIIKSHSAGVGEPLKPEQVRILFVTRIKNLSMGYSGLSLPTFKSYVKAFNLDILPLIPSQGTVGASGDLAPLAHLALGLIGEGQIYDTQTNQFRESKAILAQKGYSPLKLKQKEGLSLINGNEFIAAISAEALIKAENIAKHADLIFSVTFEALNGVQNAFHPKCHEIRNHAGQKETAERIRSLIQENGKPSELNQELKKKLNRVQDGYSIRCVPQVHGITHDTLKFIRKLVTNELNAITDNPMIFTEKDGEQYKGGTLIRAGNFHGEYGAKSMDFLAIAIHELSNISERRIERLVNPSLSKLPAFLTKTPGKSCGFMMAHVTAVSLVSENKSLCHPASVDSIPTNANKEDHVSMGGYAARKALQVINNVQHVLAIELLLACQALSFHEIGKPHPKIQKIHEIVREYVPYVEEDKPLAPFMESIMNLINSGKLLEVAQFEEKHEY